ncbi:MAG: AAA family ATPase [Pseudomonadales bacterium]
MKTAVVVSGLPASGKSTVGRALARSLAMPLLDKDDILEALFDSLGVRDAQWRALQSRASDGVLEHLALANDSAVLVSFWRDAETWSDTGTPVEWIGSNAERIVEVYCACPPQLALERFEARARHPGHLDRQQDRHEMLEGLTRLAASGPLGIGRLVRIDTARAVDVAELTARVRAALGG